MKNLSWWGVVKSSLFLVIFAAGAMGFVGIAMGVGAPAQADQQSLTTKQVGPMPQATPSPVP